MILLYGLIFFALLISGIPIAFVLGITSLITLGFFSSTPLLIIPEIMYNALASFPLMAIPFFVIAAEFMARGGSSKYLINAANAVVGFLPGGLAIVCVLTSMIFAAICGSSVATAMAMGVIIIPAMMDRGYPASFSSGLVAASGTMGILIPPSIPLILYGIIADESIPRLFMAGFLPGFLQGGLYIAWILYYSKKMSYRGDALKSGKEIGAALFKALPALCIPVVVIGGIYTGFVTVTEAAALGAVAAIFVSLAVYRECRIRDVVKITAESMKAAGMIMFIISTAIVFGTWLTQEGIPAQLVDYVMKFELPGWGFLLVVNIMLIILGMFLEVVSIMLITLPILLPMVHAFGIDPIHFAIIITVNMELALITPPVGLNLYVLSNVTKEPLSTVVRGVFPFIILSAILLLLVTYWPELSLYLPRLLMK
jgi:C4-dicarboxylate transporter, DctM subunit